ncbi:conserved hypothetical protein; putative exported protein; putative fusion protein [Cupriavidus phytorum]|uniref:Uncharacterized protein n=3 Tax=Cupriavidus TaxID=106589 RepID=A0A375BCB1_9BURK|nr:MULTISPECIES: hypothetical protein [Cupriavidus]PZX30683.1 hypothetical protein C7416_103411 [Cupriavidus alkaliphilus]SOY41359.1 conserved hypothetical protein; putative exported protein; putative fusion protein [Cupriavidus taiwanensis]
MPQLLPFAPTRSLKVIEARLARRSRVKRLVLALSAGVVALLALVPAASHAQAPVVDANPAPVTPAAPATAAPAPAPGTMAPTPGVATPPATTVPPSTTVPPAATMPPATQPAPGITAPATAAPPPTASPMPAPTGTPPAVPAPPPVAAPSQPRPPLTAPPPPPPRDAMVQRQAGPVAYICGGVAEDEQVALQSQARKYNMSLLFTQGTRGEYLSDVDVKLMRGGKEVASFVADGPRCLLKAPSGTYNVRATYQGRTKNMTVSTNSKNAQMRW